MTATPWRSRGSGPAALGRFGSSAIPWQQFEVSLRPPGLTAGEFAPIFAALRSLVGENFAQYEQSISDAANLLPRGPGFALLLEDVFQVLR